jgi:two-component system chemotaxis response regulator CheB
VRSVAAPEAVRGGTVYLAGPDRHLKLTGAAVEPTREPREHHVRPAVDVLFRSAARIFGPRTIAVVLSGYGGDGAGGVIAVRAHGGTVIVQEPHDAEVPSMPARAIATGEVQHIVPAREIPGEIGRVISRAEVAAGGSDMADEDVAQVIAKDIQEQERGERDGETAVLSCPDCGGVMWQTRHGEFVDFSCHVGHRFTSDTLLVQKTEQLEAALVTALRLLREKAILLRQTATRARANGQTRAAERLEEQAQLDDRYAELLRRDLLEAEPSPLSNAVVDEDVAHVNRGGGS